MRYIFIDLSSDNHLQQPKIFGGYSGEHNETILQVKLPSRMIGIECSGYRFDFQTSEDNKISSPLIPISELNDDVLSFHLVEQLTIAGNLLFNVVAILSNETTVSLVSKTNTVVLCIEDSPEGNVQLADPNGYKDELQKMVDERILEINPAKVDQTYNPESPNAQSGKAVAEAINTVYDNFDIKGYKMLSITHIQSMIGDVNLDGEITLKDKTLIDYYVDGTLTKSPNVLIADVNQDGIVDNTDVEIINKYILSGETSNTRIGQIVDEIKIELDDAKFEESNRAINNYTANDVVVFQSSELEFEYETYAISSLTTNDLGNTIITIAPYSITDNKFTGESVPDEIALNTNENYEYWLWVRDKSSGESVLKIQDISLVGVKSHNAKEKLLNSVSFADIDQTYNPESENAQSGKAVKQAMLNNADKNKILDYITYDITNNEVTILSCKSSISGSHIIPDTIEGYPVTSIGYSAFSDCYSLTSITIPSSVTSIGNDAFQGCEGLTSVIIPNGVTSIGQNAFFGCTGLTSITIPNSVTSIGYYAFRYCASLTSITIPSSVTSIGNDAFYGSGLTSVTIGNGVTSIDDYAFQGCTGLTSITIPNGVTSIGSGTFYDCTSLTSITIPDSVTSIGGGAFNGTNIKDIYYEGTEEQWQSIIDETDDFYNSDTLTIHYNQDLTTKEYVDGKLSEVDASIGDINTALDKIIEIQNHYISLGEQ